MVLEPKIKHFVVQMAFPGVLRWKKPMYT